MEEQAANRRRARSTEVEQRLPADIICALGQPQQPRKRRRLQRELVDRLYETLVARVCAKFNKHLERADAEELVSAALGELLDNPQQYDPDGASVENYLLMVVSRDVLNRLDREQRQPDRLSVEDLPATSRCVFPEESPASDEGAVDRDWADQVREAISELPPRPQEVVTHRAQGLTNPQIAELLDCSQPAVRVAYHRGLKRLRELLDCNAPRNEGSGDGR